MRSYRKRIWKRVGIISLLLTTVLGGVVAACEYRERRNYEELYIKVLEQLKNYQEEEIRLVSEQKDIREIYVAEAELPKHLETGDRIDVRIRYHNAEDYLVLTDKLLLKCENASGMVLELTEKEILLLSSAVSDCKTYGGTRLYAVAYPEDIQTEAGVVSYVANKDILLMLGTEQTEGERRIALEMRLGQTEQ